MAHRCGLHCITPPDLLLRIAHEGTPEHREAALRTLALDGTFRHARAQRAQRQALLPAPLAGMTGAPPKAHRTIYDQHGSDSTTFGSLARPEEQTRDTGDPAVDEAYAGFGATFNLYWEVLGRNSIDDAGLPINGAVHYGTQYDNAFWDGHAMYFGDGDGQLFTRLTKSLDVIGHELTHGVTQYTAKLEYQGQSGALNESLSDVFGSLVSQYAKGQTTETASWLIGAEVVGPALLPALRSMKDPGHANQYDDQPATMDGFVHTTKDNGGVHQNSGIPNHAFYVVASTVGGHAWEAPGKLWYDAMRDSTVKPNADFRTFAKATLRAAQERFGAGSAEESAVRDGWEAVKVPLPAPSTTAPTGRFKRASTEIPKIEPSQLT